MFPSSLPQQVNSVQLREAAESDEEARRTISSTYSEVSLMNFVRSEITECQNF